MTNPYQANFSPDFQPPLPKTQAELLARAQDLAGKTFAELAQSAHILVPQDLKRAKGWVGQLLEWHLGAQAGSKPTPDFEDLSIELKTIPVGLNGRPLETTFVCVAPLTGVQGLTWEKSHVKHKLAKVLWVPIEGDSSIPLAQRRVGFPILWQPTEAQNQALKKDWEEHMAKITLGQVGSISAKAGDVMQLRPKAANSKALTQAYGENGELIQTLPRGFYLRTQFTEQILRDFYQQMIDL